MIFVWCFIYCYQLFGFDAQNKMAISAFQLWIIILCFHYLIYISTRLRECHYLISAYFVCWRFSHLLILLLPFVCLYFRIYYSNISFSLKKGRFRFLFILQFHYESLIANNAFDINETIHDMPYLRHTWLNTRWRAALSHLSMIALPLFEIELLMTLREQACRAFYIARWRDDDFSRFAFT